jgi:hypothetical protein
MGLNKKSFSVGRWSKATFIGWLLGVFLILLLSSLLDAAGIEHMQFYLGVGMGAGVGLSQWWFFRNFINLKSSWIWASLFGMGLPFIILDEMRTDAIANKLIFGVAFGGLTTGFIQFMILRKQSATAYLWIIACVIGWTLAGLTMLVIDYTMTIKTTGSVNLLLALLNLLIILSGGLILGVCTGITLRKILSTD